MTHFDGSGPETEPPRMPLSSKPHVDLHEKSEDPVIVRPRREATSWIAVGFGALDVAQSDQFVPGTEVLVLPVIPGVPHAMLAEGSRLWRRLVDGPVRDSALSPTEREIVREMADAGLASQDIEDTARINNVPTPWLSSPTHELVYALVQQVADRTGIKVVFIKGPALHRQGLRAREHSGDVDLWVEPGKEELLSDALRPWGWRIIPYDFTRAMYHSVTLRPPEWGCEIDAHFRYPGIGADPMRVFATLYESAEHFSYAGVDAHAPSVPAAALLTALHALRPDPKSPVTATARAESVTVLRTGGPETVALAMEFDSLTVTRDSLAAAFPDLQIPNVDGEPPLNWRIRQARTMAGYHFALIRSLKWRERPRAIMQVLWPSGSASELSNERRGIYIRSRTVAQFSRLIFGIYSTIRQGIRSAFRREHKK